MVRQPTTTPQGGSAVIGGRMIVVRCLDGRLIKGTTQDFLPNKASFHVYENGDESAPAIELSLENLKAIFFVKTFDGQKGHVAKYDFTRNKGYGRKCRVTFLDNEVISGYTSGYSANRPGFFLIPAEAECNNTRIFVVNQAVKKLDWV
jgi:hypothetical protein